MSKIHNFKDSLVVGKEGEEFVLNLLQSAKSVKNIIDVSEDKFYQSVDVDFIVELMDGSSYKLEIKTDSTKYSNIFYETVSALETGSLGCFDKTEADRMVYYCSHFGIMYMFEMEEFRKWVHANKQEFDAKYLKQIKNWRYNGSTYTTQGYAIPKKLIESQPFAKKMKV